jgi:MFS family permease
VSVLAIRFVDRIGKGLRSSPRDALISDVTPPELRGTAFGLHRAMDHAGAVAGPLVAAALLELAGWPLRWIFLAAALPGAIVLAVLAFGVKEAPRESIPPRVRPVLGSLGELGPGYRRLLAAIVVFTLGNSTDAFLLLRLGMEGIDASLIAVLWAAQHAVKMVATYLGGILSDRHGRRSMIALGWLFYAAIYIAFALIDSPTVLVALFLAYGVYFGLTEPVERAWIADLAPSDRRGGAFGWYHAAIGLAALPASLLFGAVWATLGPAVAFGLGAGLALVASALLWRAPADSGHPPARDHAKSIQGS